jgi:hypothetical protein
MAKRKAKQKLSDLVPTNWLDPLLTGNRAALPAERNGKWNCRDIEALLRGVQDRIRAGERAEVGGEQQA